MPLLNRAISLIPKNRFFYKLFSQFVDSYNGNNNHNINTNGELRFIKNNFRQISMIFDIGAHFGHWTTLALKINKNLNIHCFEPSPYTFKRLIHNKFPPNVVCNNFGLSSITGEQNLYIFENGSALNSLYQRNGLQDGWGIQPQERQEKIHLDTLENYCSKRNITEIDFLKVDVEGHELEVFKGGKSLFENSKIKMIQFEHGGCAIDARIFLKDFFDFFKGMEYNFFKILPHRLKFVKRYNQKYENFQYQNWLIIKKNYKFIP